MRKKIIGLNVTTLSYNQIIASLIKEALSGISSYVCVSNVHMLIEAYKDSNFSQIVNNAKYVTTDGMPLVKAVQWLYNIPQERAAGMDLLPDLLKCSEDKNIKVLFYGGTQKMLDKTKDFCKLNYPNLDVVGLISPPFRELTESENLNYIETINTSGAGFVFVVLGCPKQEKWMASMQGKINACMIGIGGALPVLVGMQKRCPKWMQKYSLEWFYRFLQEPKRLFKRYAITNTMFVFLLLKDLFLIRVLKIETNQR